MHTDIESNIKRISATLPKEVTLIAVSKYHPIESIEVAYRAGQRHFGESKAQDLRIKQQALPHDIAWHFIGHLQSNKIKYIAPFVHLIHSIDSLRLLQEVDKHACRQQRRIGCLLQIHIACEETKFGFLPDECMAMLEGEEWRKLENVEIRGLMCMASNTNNTAQIEREFNDVKSLFDRIRNRFFADKDSFNILSAGMSEDYQIEIKAGCTHIRIGADIFGEPQKS